MKSCLTYCLNSAPLVWPNVNNRNLLTNIYYCLVYSYLSYGVEAWGSACETDLSKINVLQKKAVRIITGNQYFQIYGKTPGPLPSAEPLLKELKFLDFKDIYKFNISKFVFLTLCKMSPLIFHDWFKYAHEVHSHATRSAVIISQEDPSDPGTSVNTYTLFARHSNLENYGRKMISVSGPLIWNDIPHNIQDSVSISTFKSYLKEYYLDNYSDVWLLFSLLNWILPSYWF